MKGFRKSVLSLMLLVVFLGGACVAYAAPAGLKAPPEPSKAYKEAGIESLQYLQDWGCDLTSSGGGYINISGFTQAYQDVDYIMVRLYLQRWNGSNWVDLASWPFEKDDTSYASGVKGLHVAGGYYYRSRAEHSLTNGSVTEPATPARSYSTSIYIE
ncbi:MAG: hypothetical protein A4E55_01498 [Pelotomaculum sp. PtaU1.Bin035]|nr:MAG: hypothetical protein A4E55_01498 [Pelotomaculum sp. PtaU1.Bin035]